MSDEAACYRCPGETYAISRSVHWGRLANFYPACRACPHRDDTGPLSTRQVEQLNETRRRAVAVELFDAECLTGVEYNELTPHVARRAGTAFGLSLESPHGAPPTVVVASDGRPLAMELFAAAAEGLRLAGCAVVDLGATTAACLTFAQAAISADGALLVGNAASQPFTASLKFWGAHGQPISRGAGLDPLRSRFLEHESRPARPYGPLRRHTIEAEYLARLAPAFHALRPLRFVLDTSCRPLRRMLEQLTAQVACRFDSPAEAATAPHGRLWIDGDGECLRLTDERGAEVSGEDLLLTLATHLLAPQAGATVVLEADASAETEAALLACGARVMRSAASRAAMFTAMREREALLGGGPSGRFWFAATRPIADALQAVAHLLVVLSGSDRPVSRVLTRRLGIACGA